MSDKKNPVQNQLKGLLMQNVSNWIKEVWGAKDKVTGVKIDEEKTFTDTLSPTFYEVKEGNVTADRARIPHTYGVLWSVEDLEITVGEQLEDAGTISLFTRTYSNSSSEKISISEKLEEAIKVTDSTTIGFTEKINAGYEASVSVGVNLKVVNASASTKFTMGLELGASQSKTKTIEQTTTAGFTMQFEVMPWKRKTVTIQAQKKVGRVLNNATFVAHGKVYARVGYNGENVDKAHIYVINLDDMYKTHPHYLRFPIQYVVEDIEHDDYKIVINESDVVRDNHMKIESVEEVTTLPLEVVKSPLCLVDNNQNL